MNAPPDRKIGPQQIEDKLARAHTAFQRHRRTSFAERAAAMRRAGEIMERGVKRSGHGRELSAVGIREFVHLKTVHIAAAR